MKKVIAAVMGVVLLLSLVPAGVVLADKPSDDVTGEYKGNKAPSGKHFNLNIIGVPHATDGTLDGGAGSRIFVLRTESTKFWVYGYGNTYTIMDHDGTDGHVGWGTGPACAGIIFPYDEFASPTWRVAIYIRLVGPQTSSYSWTTEWFDKSAWWSLDQFTLNEAVDGTKFELRTDFFLQDEYRDVTWTLDEKTNYRICQIRIYLLDD